MRNAVSLAALLVTLLACGPAAPSALSGSASPTLPTASPPASPSSASAAGPTRYPSSAVRVTVNGADRPAGSDIVVDGIGGTTVTLTFPFGVDRSTIQAFLPPRGSPTWADDRTVKLSFAEGEPFPGFKIPEARSVDGLGSLELLVVNIRYAPSAVVSLYSVADVLGSSAAGAANTAAGPPSASWRVPGPDRATFLSVSPDVTRALVYPTAGSRSGQDARVVTLTTRATTAVTASGPAGDPFAFGGWLGDGRIILVGGSIRVGSPSEPLRRVADLPRADVAAAQPSPRGTSVAVALPDGILLVDLRDGSSRAVAGSSGGCAPGLAWSADDALLAWIDCAAGAVRITDVAKNAVVRTIDGPARALTAQPTGDLIVTRDSGEVGAGARSLGVRYGFDGTEKARYLGYAWSLSADGRYLLDIGSCCAGGPTSRLIDLQDAARAPVVLPGIAAWSGDGRIIVTSLGG